MALYSLYCAEVPLRNCSLTHSMTNCDTIPLPKEERGGIPQWQSSSVSSSNAISANIHLHALTSEEIIFPFHMPDCKMQSMRCVLSRS